MKSGQARRQNFPLKYMGLKPRLKVCFFKEIEY